MRSASEIERLVNQESKTAHFLAWKLWKRVPRTPSMDLDDFYADAMECLAKAAKEWDSKSVATFRTFAWKRVEWGLLDAVRKHSFMKMAGIKQKETPPEFFSLDHK